MNWNGILDLIKWIIIWNEWSLKRYDILYIKMIWNEVLKGMIFLILNDLKNGVWKIGHFDINMI